MSTNEHPATTGRTTEDVLAERGKTHGHYNVHARVTQRLKEVVRKELIQQAKVLDMTEQEALDMIFHKIGRIVAGDAKFGDHWADIAGYAKLNERYDDSGEKK